MIFYTGLGYLVVILFVGPLIVFGLLLHKGFGIDVFTTKSSWPIHSLMIFGALLVTLVGWGLNRKQIKEVTYEKSGPVTVLKPPHTLYGIRMEHWGPIGLVIYFVLAALRYYR